MTSIRCRVVLISIFLSGSSLTIFDPDIDVCERPEVDEAVFTDSGISYIFKGKYFWTTNKLYAENGINGYGKLITTKWPEIKSQIKAAFVVPRPGGNNSSLGNHWYGYENGLKTTDGTTDNWPDFNDLKVTASVEHKRGFAKVVFLNANNKMATLFDFTSLSRPKVIGSFATSLRSGQLMFWDDLSAKRDLNEETTLDQVINASAALAYDTRLVLLAKNNYCIVDMTLGMYEKTCTPIAGTDKLFKCPIDVTDRPVLATEPNKGQTGLDSNTTEPEQVGEEDETDAAVSVTPSNGTAVAYDEEVVNRYIMLYMIGHVVVTVVAMVVITIVYSMGKRAKGTITYIEDKPKS